MLLYIPVINIRHPGSWRSFLCCIFDTSRKGRAFLPDRAQEKKQECASLGSGAKKCSDPGALAGDPTGPSATSGPSLPKPAQCL